MDGKWLFSHGKNFFIAKKSIFIHFTSKYVLFQHTKNFFVWTKYILSRQMDGASFLKYQLFTFSMNYFLQLLKVNQGQPNKSFTRLFTWSFWQFIIDAFFIISLEDRYLWWIYPMCSKYQIDCVIEFGRSQWRSQSPYEQNLEIYND